MLLLRKILVISSFIALLAYAAFWISVVVNIDSGVASVGAVAAIILVAVAVMTGMAAPDDGLDTLWKRACLGWLNLASSRTSLTCLHVCGVAILFGLCFLAFPHSIHKVELDPSFDYSKSDVKFTWRSLLGNSKEAVRVGHSLSDIWIPFKRAESIQLDVAEGDDHRICSLKANSISCPPLLIGADFAIESATQSVDMRGWNLPGPSKSPSLVTYDFVLVIKRVKRDAVFERYASTSSPDGLDCQILSGNASCAEVSSGAAGLPNRRTYKITLDPAAFPVGVSVPLKYRATYKNAFFFKNVNETVCTGCDVTFTSNYPVADLQLHMLFPNSFTWKKLSIVSDGLSVDRFNCSSPSATSFDYERKSLAAKSMLIFNVFATPKLDCGP